MQGRGTQRDEDVTQVFPALRKHEHQAKPLHSDLSLPHARWYEGFSMTGPADPLLGVPEPHWGNNGGAPVADVAGNGGIGGAQPAQPGTEAAWVNTELHTIASTIEELQSRLEQANARLSSAERTETTEVEIGRLFVEAQRFSEASLSKLEARVHEVLLAAEDKAKQILAEATEEARAIRRAAQEAAFASTETVRELQSAIAGFTTVNAALLNELGTLNSMLSPVPNNGAARIGDNSSPAGLNSTEPA